MRIVTWNVNSIGARIDRVLAWVEANQPDVLALQELKCTSEAFPAAGFEALGYHVEAHGNGRSAKALESKALSYSNDL